MGLLHVPEEVQPLSWGPFFNQSQSSTSWACGWWPTLSPEEALRVSLAPPPGPCAHREGTHHWHAYDVTLACPFIQHSFIPPSSATCLHSNSPSLQLLVLPSLIHSHIHWIPSVYLAPLQAMGIQEWTRKSACPCQVHIVTSSQMMPMWPDHRPRFG